jgi:hypothetical protein
MQITGLGSVKVRVALCDNDNGLFLAKRLDKLDGAFAAYCERKNSVRKKNSIPHGKNG